MIQAVSSSASAETLVRSVEALSDVLRTSTEQSLELARKLLAVSVQGAVQGFQDPLLGTVIDTSA